MSFPVQLKDRAHDKHHMHIRRKICIKSEVDQAIAVHNNKTRGVEKGYFRANARHVACPRYIRGKNCA